MSNSPREMDTRPWSVAIARLMARTEEYGTRIIGLTGNRNGVGVSSFCRAIASTYVRHGVDAFVVDASRLGLSETPVAGSEASTFNLADAAVKVSGYSYIDLEPVARHLPPEKAGMTQLLETMAGDASAVIVDLPPIGSELAENNRVLRSIGAACKVAYLICVSGEITRREMTETMEIAKFNGIPIDSIVVNDWKESFLWMLTRRQ